MIYRQDIDNIIDAITMIFCSFALTPFALWFALFIADLKCNAFIGLANSRTNTLFTTQSELYIYAYNIHKAL